MSFNPPSVGQFDWAASLNETLGDLDSRITGVGAAVGSKAFLNAQDYGALADGSDDLTPINNAIAAASTALVFGPTTVMLPWTATGYGVTNVVAMKTGVTLSGQGLVQLKAIGGSRSFLVNATGQTNVVVEKLTLDANSLVTSATVRASAGTGGMTVQKCAFKNTGSTLPLCGFDTQGTVSDISVINNTFDFAGTNTIRANSTIAGLVIEKNIITNWVERGIYILGTATTAVTKLYMQKNEVFAPKPGGGGASRYPIDIEGNSANKHNDVWCDDNRVIGPGTSYNDPTTPGTADQISIRQVKGLHCTGNVSMYGGDVGITISTGVENATVRDNKCMFNDTDGIFCSAAGGTIGGNILKNNGQNRHSDRLDVNRAGLRLDGASNIAVGTNTYGDDQATKTQKYGASVKNCTNVNFGVDVDAGNALALYFNESGNVNCTKASTVAF